MYYYILDQNHLDQQTFERKQVELQGLLAEFKITGEIGRVTSLRSIQDLVETASERGVKTLVACGSDDTFNLMLSCLRGRDFTLGFIPLDDSSYLSKILGVESVYNAVKTIAGRRIEKIDLAVMGRTYFISYVEFGITSAQLKNISWWKSLRTPKFPEHTISVRIDNSYTMDIACLGGMVANTRSTSAKNSSIANPTDGFLDLLIIEKLGRLELMKYKDLIAEGLFEQIPGTSVIKCRKIEFLQPQGLGLTMAGRIFTKMPASIEIIPLRLRLIVGKNRTF